MFTTQDVESIHPEELIRSELDPLIPRDEKGPTKKEERVARAQFLALCLALFVVGWTDGSTGPLLPRIQVFYNVSLSWPIPLTFFLNQPPILQVGFGTVSWVFVLQCTVSDTLLGRDTRCRDVDAIFFRGQLWVHCSTCR